MKKLLKVSLVAMLVAAPFAARAEGEPMDAGTAPFAGVDATAVADVASTSYVKGAYNDVVGKINKVAETAAAGQTAAQVTTAITNAAGTTANTSLAGSNGVLTVQVDGTHVARDASGNLTLSATDIASLGKADTALQSNSALNGANLTAGTVAETALDSATQAKLNAGNSALQETDLDGTTIEVDGTSNKVQVKAGSIGTTQLASGVVTSLGKADTALQNDSALNGANLTAGTVAETALDSATQAKLNAGNSALQETDLDGTTIEVDDTTNKVQVVAGSIGTTQLASGVVTSLGKADTALQSNSALNGANLTAGTVAETALDSTLATKINNAAAAKAIKVHTVWNTNTTANATDVIVDAE